MTKFDWFDEAVEAITAAAKQPSFPGDEPPVRGYVEKLVNRVFAECHNGGEVGKDECPVCRAMRTEKAERLRDEYAKVVQGQSFDLNEMGVKVQGLEAKLSEAAQKIVALGMSVESLKALCDDWAGRFNQAHAAELSLKDMVRSQAETLSQLQRVNVDQGEAVRVFEQRLKKMKDLVKEVLEA